MKIDLPQKIIDSFAPTRERIQAAVNNQPKQVSFEDAWRQVHKRSVNFDDEVLTRNKEEQSLNL